MILKAGTLDHGGLTGLSDDDHSIYALLAGRSGGQTLIGGTASGNDLVLQSTSNATRGHVEVEDLMKVGTSTHAFGAAHDFYIDLATSGAATVTTGAITGMRFAPTVTVSGNSATTVMALFNNQSTITDDGTARTVGSALIFASQNTYTATVASGITATDLSGVIPANTGLYYTLTTNRTGAGTGTMASAAAVYVSAATNIGVGWTLTNYIGMLIDAPTVGGTLTNLYGIKNNVNSATNRWFLYSGGTAQNYLAGRLGIGITVPLSKLHIEGSSGWIICDEQDTDPTTTELDSQDSVSVYMKNGKIVFAYNNGGTMTYLRCTLDGSTTTWVNNTTAP